LKKVRVPNTFVGFEVLASDALSNIGELAVWRLGEKYNQVDPLRDVELKPGATVSGMSWTVAADKVVGVIVRRQQRTEEVYSWDIKMKKNLKKAATDSPRKGYSPND
jgi:hypothetical protein